MISKTRSQFDKALLGLRSLVLSHEFAAGQRVSEVAVADRLGISRTPLRQAMDRLVADGLLERIEKGGCRVATFSARDIADAIEMRGVCEGMAARLAAERGTAPDLLAEAAGVLDQIDAAMECFSEATLDIYMSRNDQFHRLLARFPASPLIQREVERVSVLPLASPFIFVGDRVKVPGFQNTLRIGQLQHRAILDAIERREGSRAEALTREHARLALTNFDDLSKEAGASGYRALGMAAVASV